MVPPVAEGMLTMALHAVPGLSFHARSFSETTIGRKVFMAVTGAILFLFVIGHMVGNLQIYAGEQKLNNYAHLLRSIPAVLWFVRLTLLFCVGVHIWAAVATTLKSWQGRSVGYQHRPRHDAATLPSLSMRWTGPMIFSFVVYHLLHLTIGAAHGDFVEGDVYHNVIAGFSNPLVSGAYLVAMFLLGMHLVHGAWSGFQTLGFNNFKWSARLRLVAAGATALIVLGNISIPISVMLGILRPAL